MDEILFEVESHMETAMDYLRKEYRGIRTGRASGGLVEHSKVDYYGSPTDLRSLATISTPESNLIVIKPFDPSGMKDIERAIQASDLGITPNTDGRVIRLSVPPLSIERRNQLAGQVKKMAEAARVTIRNARRDGNKLTDTTQKASDLTEDQAKKGKDSIQKLTDSFEKKITELLTAKTTEIQET